MKRLLLALVVAAMLLISSALPALANHEMGDPTDVPGQPKCDWYGPFGEGHQSWWEYWCYWPHWGWEFVFWVWA
jgi:Spy/CpxP family protein refolding chaperone